MTECPFGGIIHDFADGVLLREDRHENDSIFVMMYAHTARPGEDVGPRGIAGFRHGGKTFTFDRLGVEDSWYPMEYGEEKADTQKIFSLFAQQMDIARERYAAHLEREKAGTVVNFGPVKRTLLPEEIEKYRKLIASRKSFSLTPSGFGTGYRFYSGSGPGRYGQGMPASKEARELLAAPRLIYDTLDCD